MRRVRWRIFSNSASAGARSPHLHEFCARKIIVPFLGAYTASKFALEALAESYQHQLSSWGMESVILQPGRHATAEGSTLRSPSESGRGAGYGPVAAQIDRAAADFRASFANGQAPAPPAVIDADVSVLAMPPGTRPLRIPIPAIGLEQIKRRW